MSIHLHETFEVRATIGDVWSFMLDPTRVAACMPGARLDEVVDDTTYLGTIRVKLGAITTNYQGKIRLTEIDQAGFIVAMVAEGRETGGGTAQGKMSSRLNALDSQNTEVVTEATIEVTGRVAQMGRGMIQGVSQQLFQQFVACARASLESPERAAAQQQEAEKPVSILPIAVGVLWSSILRLFRGLFRRGDRGAEKG
jgi:carbon monoxide dehydrogenase subunit G